MACEAQVRNKATWAEFSGTNLTVDDLKGCATAAEAKNDEAYTALRKNLKGRRDALVALRDYYSEWKAIMEGDLTQPARVWDIERLHQKAAALKLSID